ncbi:hypothetical protein [uncultured Mycobacterium sp.]|uniref:hypothetical protein n=1 Tax=uncultured Mycobacterium sp. TaxID=171292 RepID=UPI0035CB4AA1
MIRAIGLISVPAVGSAPGHREPVWSKPLLAVGIVVILLGFFATDRVEDRWMRRRVYWSAWTLGGLLAAVAVRYGGWGATAKRKTPHTPSRLCTSAS